MTLFRLQDNLQNMMARINTKVAMVIVTLAMSFVNIAESAAIPFAMPAIVDTTAYRNFPFVRFIDEKDSIKLTDEEFFDIAGKVIFPINKWDLPKRDSLILLLENEVLPLINNDSLELVHMMLRGAASPEGPYRFNKFLGHKRAETLFNFIKENLTMPIDENFEMEIDIEDYRTLCLLMRRQGDKDYGYVQAMCDQYLPTNQIVKLKSVLVKARQGTLWLRLYREYFHRLRAARIVFFFRAPHTYAHKVIPEKPIETTEQPVQPIKPVVPPVDDEVTPDVSYITVTEREPRREVLSVKTNLLFDFAYVPGYDRWCPIPNIAVEYYPRNGHFTYGASIDFPWWQHYNKYKYFQIRNYQLEARYYFRNGGIKYRPMGEGAAFRGLYLQAYAHAAVYSLCFGRDRGWFGEGLGGGLGIGYVMPISKKGHWRLEFGAQFGYFLAAYDKYQFGNPKTGEDDGLYYYKWTQSRESFKKRQYRYNWFGPTRVGVTLVYDLLYRRNAKKGISFRPWEKVTRVTEVINSEEINNSSTDEEKGGNR